MKNIKPRDLDSILAGTLVSNVNITEKDIEEFARKLKDDVNKEIRIAEETGEDVDIVNLYIDVSDTLIKSLDDSIVKQIVNVCKSSNNPKFSKSYTEAFELYQELVKNSNDRVNKPMKTISRFILIYLNDENDNIWSGVDWY